MKKDIANHNFYIKKIITVIKNQASVNHKPSWCKIDIQMLSHIFFLEAAHTALMMEWSLLSLKAIFCILLIMPSTPCRFTTINTSSSTVILRLIQTHCVLARFTLQRQSAVRKSIL